MNKQTELTSSENTVELKTFIRGLGIDLVGIARIDQLRDMPTGLPGSTEYFLRVGYTNAIVLGAQLSKLGKTATGNDVSLFLEKTAIEICSFLEARKKGALIIHTEDEYDPIHRIGLMSLKVLAKAAGLGWQGRSLLIISPEHGPVHRLIAVLTNIELIADAPLPNRCGRCSLCVDQCPQKALSLIDFDDHPSHREQVLDINTCTGDDGCLVCLQACPWGKKQRDKTDPKKE